MKKFLDRRRFRLWLLSSLVDSLVICTGYGRRPFRQYPGVEYDNFPLPSDWPVPGEWTFARLTYPPVGFGFGFGFRQSGGEWKLGYSSWTIDYPRSDRHLITAVGRLTKLQARSVEEAVDLDDGSEV